MTVDSSLSTDFLPSEQRPEVAHLILRQAVRSTAGAITGAIIATCIPYAGATSWTGSEGSAGRAPAQAAGLRSARQYGFRVSPSDGGAVEEAFGRQPGIPSVVERLGSLLGVSATVRALSDAEEGRTFVVAEFASGLASREQREQFDDRIDEILSSDRDFQAVSDVLIVAQV